jgi:hypothetical protein
MPEAMLPRCAHCVLVVCPERGRSEDVDARCAHGAIDAHDEGLGAWLQVGRVGRSWGRPDCGSW